MLLLSFNYYDFIYALTSHLQIPYLHIFIHILMLLSGACSDNRKVLLCTVSCQILVGSADMALISC